MPQFTENTNDPAVYFKTLHLENVRCFKGRHTINLDSDKLTQWTVILGNNNTGKSTILKALGDMNKFEKIPHKKLNTDINKNRDYYGLLKFKRIYDLLIKLKSQIKVSFLGIENELQTISFGDKKIDYGTWIIHRTNEEEISQQDTYLFNLHILKITKLNLIGYGTSRFMSNNGVSDDSTAGLFDNKTELLNAEKWFVDLDLAQTKEIKGAKKRYDQVEKIFCCGLLPDVTKIRITTIPDKSSYETFPEFETSYGWLRLRDLGYGYQATLTWVADLAKRMFDRYPDLENPLHGPAVVLVDEIDLHLHPEWQRKIIKYLSDLFLHTQFIVTAHSPLIVQSAKDVNVIMLEKDDDNINIRQRFGSFQGWTVDEILTELMQLGERTRSDRYLELMQEFENAALDNDHKKAQIAYNELDAILSPSSYQRKVLQIQMSSLMPVVL